MGRITKSNKQEAEDIFGCMRGMIEVVGDIESPGTPLEDWDAIQLPPEDDIESAHD